MNISDGLLLLKDLSEEISRLRQLSQQSAWSYRGTSHPDAEWIPNFDLKENQEDVKGLSRLHRRLSKAIAKANVTTKLDLDEEAYKGWL